MSSAPGVSVLLPTFNRRVDVIRAVASALPAVDGCTHEVIVLDDGSTDGTLEALAQAFSEAVSGGRLKLVRGEPGGDPAYARNRAAGMARGEFLAFLDSDDYWVPGRLSRIAVALERVDLIFEVPPPVDLPSDPLKWLIAGNGTITSGTLIRKALFKASGGFPERYFGPKRKFFKGFEDYELWLKAVLLLDRADRLDRIRIVGAGDVIREIRTGGAGEMPLKTQMSREAVTLIKLLGRIPGRCQGIWAKRLAGAAKAIILG